MTAGDDEPFGGLSPGRQLIAPTAERQPPRRGGNGDGRLRKRPVDALDDLIDGAQEFEDLDSDDDERPEPNGQDPEPLGDHDAEPEPPIDDRQPLVLDPSAPLAIARAFVATRYTQRGVCLLHHHRSVFWQWSGGHYQPLDDGTLRAELYHFFERARTPHGEPIKPTARKVSDALDALRAATNLPADLEPPCWLPGSTDRDHEWAPSDVLACPSGLLHLPTMQQRPATPLFFATSGLDFDYDPYAPEPREWLAFLDSLWPQDREARDCLQEMFGYLLTPRREQEKVFLIVGPKRSGKGTIARILRHLLGRGNCVSPTLSNLAGNFGLQPLIGKTLATVSDARLSGRADQQVVVERLLSISGRDAITVDRKFREAWTGELPTRFLILSNELPRLGDASGALASRFVILTLECSFFGREDHGLQARLLPELPGILRWAIEGRRRLDARGHFLPPASSESAVQELEDLTAPIGTFIREQCVVEPTRSVQVKVLFDAWRQWCDARGWKHPGTEQSFGRDLRAAQAGVETRRFRVEGRIQRFFCGIGLEP